MLTPVFHWSLSTIFSSNKILQHNLNSNTSNRPYTDHIHVYHTYYTYHTYRTDPASTAHALQMYSFCIQARQTMSAMLSTASTLYIAATHNKTHSPMHISTCTPSTTHHTAFNNPLHTTNKHTKHICVSGGKIDVGMVWKCCGVIDSHLVWLVF